MIVYLVKWHDDERFSGTVAAFSSQELAEQCLKKKLAWKDEFQKKFKKSYDELYDSYKLKDKHQDWLYEHNVDTHTSYYIERFHVYDENELEELKNKELV